MRSVMKMARTATTNFRPTSRKIALALACAALTLGTCLGPAFADADQRNGEHQAREHHDRDSHKHQDRQWHEGRGHEGYSSAAPPYDYGPPASYYSSPGFGMTFAPGVGVYLPLGARR